MTEHPSFVPKLWAPDLYEALLQQPKLLELAAAEQRAADERLRVEHPWRWRWKQARTWLTRRRRRFRRRLARIVPIRARWVGFGCPEWSDWWEHEEDGW